MFRYKEDKVMALCAKCYINLEIPDLYEEIKKERPPKSNSYNNIKCRLCKEFAVIKERLYDR